MSETSNLLTFTVVGISFNMIKVEPSTFMMGCAPNQEEDAYDDEQPRHQVTLTQSYYIGEAQVTQALWQAVMGNNPSYFTGDLQRPVERVSWHDCQEFIEKLNQLTGKQFTLPTEAQWEYAARGGNRSKGFKYAGSDDLDE
ncbi:MAG: formylglycine-generating enzyme family protein, partial [Paludibacteraceae bacterium]|nr:formylglycine-generating enzyme family protein [Paludibacteraceae bacterium]